MRAGGSHEAAKSSQEAGGSNLRVLILIELFPHTLTFSLDWGLALGSSVAVLGSLVTIAAKLFLEADDGVLPPREEDEWGKERFPRLGNQILGVSGADNIFRSILPNSSHVLSYAYGRTASPRTWRTSSRESKILVRSFVSFVTHPGPSRK